MYQLHMNNIIHKDAVCPNLINLVKNSFVLALTFKIVMEVKVFSAKRVMHHTND